jgi:hypothetical protein
MTGNASEVLKLVRAQADAAAPVGRCLSLIVDARTFRVLDAGHGPRLPVSPASLRLVTYVTGRPS